MAACEIADGILFRASTRLWLFLVGQLICSGITSSVVKLFWLCGSAFAILSLLTL